MKNLLNISAAELSYWAGFMLFSVEMASSNDDGVYASRNNTETSSVNNNAPVASSPDNGTPYSYTNPSDSNKVQNNTYAGDYSDYDYSARIKRYDQDWDTMGITIMFTPIHITTATIHTNTV